MMLLHTVPMHEHALADDAKARIAGRIIFGKAHAIRSCSGGRVDSNGSLWMWHAEAENAMLWDIGLSSWFIQEGNYGDFAAGQIAETAVGFCPRPGREFDEAGAMPITFRRVSCCRLSRSA